ncbi:hypothetical protein M9H77_27202 [Catharanthus roseus]|uniref:Uncharacterized protein n=1 Tax=Catharanthus roseus TaxID=4058 RepID=A0ACC0ADZ5_CATRO|nr:hypothetical protein M9H77_27202 [Catharanthus roseus]
MQELGSDGLISGIQALSVERHCCITCSFKLGISSERSGAQQATEVLGQEFLDQISPERHITDPKILFCTYYMAHPCHRWTYREGTLVDEPSGTTSSSSSSYSLREIVPEREPIAVIDLSDDESVEGPEMAPDPSEPTSDSEMTPELEGVAPVNTEGTGTFIAGGSPLSVLPICGYCLWREQRAEAAS